MKKVIEKVSEEEKFYCNRCGKEVKRSAYSNAENFSMEFSNDFASSVLNNYETLIRKTILFKIDEKLTDVDFCKDCLEELFNDIWNYSYNKIVEFAKEAK